MVVVDIGKAYGRKREETHRKRERERKLVNNTRLACTYVKNIAHVSFYHLGDLLIKYAHAALLICAKIVGETSAFVW